MYEMNRLHEMLLKAGINHTFTSMDKNVFGAEALQIRIYKDDTFKEELDDVIYHKFSHGFSLGLLETFRLGDCNGFETADQVFNGWINKFFS